MKHRCRDGADIGGFVSEIEPKEPYVYQPYGVITHQDRAKTGRLFGIGGLHPHAQVKGLTKEEAEAVLKAIKSCRRQIRGGVSAGRVR